MDCDRRVPAELGQESQASSCLRKGTPLASRVAQSELKWTGMGEFNSDDHYIYYCGQESLRRNGVAIMVKQALGKAALGALFA